MLLKASAISSLTDARYFAARGVQWIGFDLEKITPAKAKEIIGWLEGLQVMGEFKHTPAEQIFEIASTLSLHGIQTGLVHSPQDALALSTFTVFHTIVIDAQFDTDLAAQMNPYAEEVAAFVVDLSANHILWDDFKASRLYPQFVAMTQQHRVVLQLDWRMTDLMDVLDNLDLHGLSFVGSDETLVGVKSFDEFDLLFDLLDDSL